MKDETIKVLEEAISFGVDKSFLQRIQKIIGHKKKNPHEVDYVKIKKFYSSADSVRKMKKQAIN